MKKVFIICWMVAFFSFTTLAQAGAPASHILTEKLIDRTIGVGIYIQNITTGNSFYSDVYIDSEGFFSTNFSSDLIETGMSVIYFNGFDENGNQTIYAMTECLMKTGKNNIKVEILPLLGYYVKINLGNIDAETVEVTNNNIFYSSKKTVHQDENGNDYIGVWIGINETVEINTGKQVLFATITEENFLNRDEITAISEKEENTSVLCIPVICKKRIYPIDFEEGLSLEQAIAELNEGETLKIVNNSIDTSELNIFASKNITIEGDSNHSHHLRVDNIFVIYDENNPNAIVTLKNFFVYDGIKKGKANLVLDHCLIFGKDDQPMITGETNIVIDHSTFAGNRGNYENDSEPINCCILDLTSHKEKVAIVTNSIFHNAKSIFYFNCPTAGSNNLIWKLKNSNIPNSWDNTLIRDPKFIDLRYTPSNYFLNGVATDGSYIGAVIPYYGNNNEKG